MVPLILDAVLGENAWLSRSRAIELLSANAARLFGLDRKGSLAVGYDADILAIDPTARHILSASDLHDAAGYSPYEGKRLRGSITDVWRRGSRVISDGVANHSGGGIFVPKSPTTGPTHV
jgi:dihydroorotase-like cyclic amidohydrolase